MCNFLLKNSRRLVVLLLFIKFVPIHNYLGMVWRIMEWISKYWNNVLNYKWWKWSILDKEEQIGNTLITFETYHGNIRNVCRKPSFGLATMARACKGAGQEGSPRVTSHVLGSVGECEGMNPHIPKGAPTLGVGIPVDFRMFKEQLQGSKPIGLTHSLYHWKAFRT
jgi:hypothetical protein